MKQLDKLTSAIKFYIDKIEEHNNSISNNLQKIRLLEADNNMYDMHKKRKKDELIKENEESMFMIENLLIDRKKFVESTDIKLLQEIKDNTTIAVNDIVDKNRDIQNLVYNLYDEILKLKEGLQANNNEILDIKQKYNNSMKIFERKFDTKISNERIIVVGIDEYKRDIDNKVSDTEFIKRFNKVEKVKKQIYDEVGNNELEKINRFQELKQKKEK